MRTCDQLIPPNAFFSVTIPRAGCFIHSRCLQGFLSQIVVVHTVPRGLFVGGNEYASNSFGFICSSDGRSRSMQRSSAKLSGLTCRSLIAPAAIQCSRPSPVPLNGDHRNDGHVTQLEPLHNG